VGFSRKEKKRLEMAQAPSGAMAKLRPSLPRWSRSWVLGILLLPPLVFLGLATVRLDAQGLYYDELHQATGAFTYLGMPPEMFSLEPIHGLPLLNMPYSGALKTAIYGLYLRFVNPEFSVVSWRMVGISFVAVGLVVFTLLGKRIMSPVPFLVILALILTDTNLLLCTRHDWGPVALGFTLRLMLIGVWLRSEAVEHPSLGSSFALGGLTGIAVFEKLSSVVLVLALVWLLLIGKRRATRHWLAAAAGVCLGALPVILINLKSLITRHELFFQGDILAPERSWGMFLDYVWRYLGLGAGEEVQQFILGSSVSPMPGGLEQWLILAALALAVIYAGAHSSQRAAQLTLVAAGCYVSICVGLFLLPQITSVHHWVVGTPFQYVAIGLGLETLINTSPLSRRARPLGLVTRFIVVILLATRLVGLDFLEGALWRGQAGKAWNPDMTELGRLAAAHTNDAIFVAADWGVKTQIYCFTNGRPGFVYEAYWSYNRPEDLMRLQQQPEKALYAVALNPPSVVRPENTKRIFRDLAGSGYWRETPVEPEFSKLAAVTVRKFVPISSGNVPLSDNDQIRRSQ
jgi:hypothetical protein